MLRGALMSRARGMDSRAAIVGATALGIAAAAMFMIQPGHVEALVRSGGLSSGQAGYVAASEMTGLALTTIAMSYHRLRLTWQSAANAFAFCVAAANLPSLLIAGRRRATVVSVPLLEQAEPTT